jgi:hypothetical protein
VQRTPQPTIQNHIRVGVPLRRRFAGRNLRAVRHGIAEGVEPSERGFFDDGFGELDRQSLLTAALSEPSRHLDQRDFL